MKHRSFVLLTIALSISSMLAAAPSRCEAGVQTLDFSSLRHGELVGSQFVDQGVTISGYNLVRKYSAVAAFDTTKPSSVDPDLNGPSWKTGNLKASAPVLGMALILPENLKDRNGDGLLDSPDDEGTKPAGYFEFVFSKSISMFGLDLIDIESDQEKNGGLTFYSGNESKTLTFGQLKSLDPSVAYGDNSANRIDPILAESLGLSGFDKVKVFMNGSGAVDNVTFGTPTNNDPVPEPASLAIWAIGGLAGLGYYARRRRVSAA